MKCSNIFHQIKIFTLGTEEGQSCEKEVGLISHVTGMCQGCERGNLPMSEHKAGKNASFLGIKPTQMLHECRMSITNHF